MREYVYAKHTVCWTDLEWRRVADANGDDEMVIYCPKCQREVPREESTVRGAVCAMLREQHD